MRIALVLCLAVGLAGCGSTGSPGNTPKEAFAGTCGSCHALKAAGTSGTFGPDLDDLKPSIAQVENQIAHGGGGMPAGLLKGAQAQQVAAYVANSAGK